MLCRYCEAFGLTYLSRLRRAGVGTLPLVCIKVQVQVVKASSGHFPQPFLISKSLKNWRKDRDLYQNNKPLFLPV